MEKTNAKWLNDISILKYLLINILMLINSHSSTISLGINF